MPAIYTTNTIYCDVLVIGGGAAGCCAAAAALEKNVRVCIAVKGSFSQIGVRGSGASSCGNTEGGLPRLPDINGIQYDKEQMVEHAIQAGLGMADRSLVHVLAEKAPETRKDLEKWGCSFTAVGASGLGHPFVRALEKKIRIGAVLLEHTMIYDLILSEGICTGALGYDTSGKQYIMYASSVIITSGGNAQLFAHNVHPPCTTGDGYAMALRSGAQLMNMEFMQIFTATVWPTRNLVHTWKTRQLEELYNRHGHYFLEDYLPEGISAQRCREENVRHAPFSTRDKASRYLAVGIVQEIIEGRGSDNGGVYLDMRKSFKDMKPGAREFFLYKGIDVEHTPLEITMAHQCSNGGITVSTEAMSSVPGLFAAGEAITGTHGADRIGANMLAQCAVFGRIAGISAASYAQKQRNIPVIPTAIPEFPLTESKHASFEETQRYKTTFRSKAWKQGLVLRNKTGLEDWYQFMDSSNEELFSYTSSYSPEEIITLLELRNLILVGKAVCLSALERNESRGPHYRSDFPDIDMKQPAAVSEVTLNGEGAVCLQKNRIDPEWDDSLSLSFGSKRWG